MYRAAATTLGIVRAALHTALAALPPDALIGIIAVSTAISVYLLSSASPYVRHIPVPPKGEPLPIADVLGRQVERMLGRVGADADKIALAIETIGPAPLDLAGGGDDDATSPGHGGGRFAFGGAMAAVLDMLSAASHLGPPRILAFVGTRPDHGAGALPPLLASHARSGGGTGSGTGEEEGDEEEEGEGVPRGALSGARRYYHTLGHDLACVSAAVFLYAVAPAAAGGGRAAASASPPSNRS